MLAAVSRLTCLRCGTPLGAALGVGVAVEAGVAAVVVPAVAIGTIGPRPELSIAQTQMIERPLNLRIASYDTVYPYWFRQFAGLGRTLTSSAPLVYS